MTIKVGLLGHSGLIGSAIFQSLIEVNNEGKINLVILHRKSSNIDNIPNEVEKRLIQLDENGFEVNRAAIEGLEVVISLIGATSIPLQTHLLDALAQSPSLKTFIPSDFGVSWISAELESPEIKKLVNEDDKITLKAKELGVPLTNIRIGLLDYFFFTHPYFATNPKENKIQLFRNSLNKPLRLTSLSYLGYCLSQLVLQPALLPNRIIHIFNLSPTGQELIQIFTKINGKTPNIEYYNENSFKSDFYSEDIMLVLATLLKLKWAEDSWKVNDEEEVYEFVKVEVQGGDYRVKNLEEVVREYL